MSTLSLIIALLYLYHNSQTVSMAPIYAHECISFKADRKGCLSLVLKILSAYLGRFFYAALYSDVPGA